MGYLYLYLISFVIFFAIDLVWLGVIAKDLYKEHIGFLMTDQIKWLPAILFYLLYLIGLNYFSVIPALRINVWSVALINGALFGLICYATYDLTNLATLKGWPTREHLFRQQLPQSSILSPITLKFCDRPFLYILFSPIFFCLDLMHEGIMKWKLF